MHLPRGHFKTVGLGCPQVLGSGREEISGFLQPRETDGGNQGRCDDSLGDQ